MKMENFSYMFSLSANMDDDSDGKMKVHIKYDDASGIGVDLNREFDEDTYQDGVSSMLEDLETQLANAITAKQIRDTFQEETEEERDETEELYRALDRLQDKIDRLERKISLMNSDQTENPKDERKPFPPFGKIWC